MSRLNNQDDLFVPWDDFSATQLENVEKFAVNKKNSYLVSTISSHAPLFYRYINMVYHLECRKSGRKSNFILTQPFQNNSRRFSRRVTWFTHQKHSKIKNSFR